jgi:hypothetical protein
MQRADLILSSGLAGLGHRPDPALAVSEEAHPPLEVSPRPGPAEEEDHGHHHGHAH